MLATGRRARAERRQVDDDASPNEQQQLASSWDVANRLRGVGQGFKHAQPAEAPRIPAAVDAPWVATGFGTPVALVDRPHKARAVGGESLWRVSAARRDDCRDVVRPQLVDGGGRDLLGLNRAPQVRNRAIHQNDDNPPFLFRDLVGRDVGSCVLRPYGFLRARARRDVHGGEITNRPPHAVLQYGEFIGRQAPHRPPLLVEHGDIQLHELDAASERRLIDLFLRQYSRRDQDEECRVDDSPHGVHAPIWAG